MRNLKLKVYKEESGEWVYDVIDAEQAHRWSKPSLVGVVGLGTVERGTPPTFENALAAAIEDLQGRQ